MPAFLTHKVAADNVRSAITDPEVSRIIDASEGAYYSGAQGGDYFYSYKYYSMWAGHRFKMFGWALHRARLQRFFAEGAQYLKDNPSDVARSFFLGYITHYAMDMYVHPLILKMGPKAMSSHNIVECALDCMYAVRNGVDPWSFDKAQFIHDTHVPTHEIDDFLSAMMDKIYYGFTLPPDPYQTTYAYFEKFHRMLQKTGKKDMFFKHIRDCFTILKTATLVYRPYDEIKDEFDYDLLFARIDAAIDHAMRMIEAVSGFWEGRHDITVLKEVFYNINMNGVPITPIEIRKPFRRLYRKAPTIW